MIKESDKVIETEFNKPLLRILKIVLNDGFVKMYKKKVK